MEIERRGGMGLFKYHPSLRSALQAAFPDYPWQPERFVFRKQSEFRPRRGVLNPAALRPSTVPRLIARPNKGEWADHQAQKQFLEAIGASLGVTEVMNLSYVFRTYPFFLFFKLPVS